MGPRFIHDFAEVRLRPDALLEEPVHLPRRLADLIGPAFDRTMTAGAGPWPLATGPVHRRDDGWMYPVRWPGGRNGLVPCVEADLGLYPTHHGSSHLELLGTYSGWCPPKRSRFDLPSHLRTVQGIRGLLLALAADLAADPIPIGPVAAPAVPAPSVRSVDDGPASASPPGR